MLFKLQWIVVIGLLFIWGCKSKTKEFSINGEFEGGAGKYIKYVDMLVPGGKPDSIELDLDGKFEFSKEITEPHDYIFYFTTDEVIRITPLPQQQIVIKGEASHLIKSYTVTGSFDSDLISQMLKKQQLLTEELDSVRMFYMCNQLNPNIDSVVRVARDRSDSLLSAGKEMLTKIINDHPGSLASYVALAQKLNYDYNFFTIEHDLPLFQKVDSAMQVKYDTATVVNMLHGYIERSKNMLAPEPAKVNGLRIGQQAVEIRLPNVFGDTMSLSDLKGKYVLIDFWGSWCRPCRNENVNLRNVYAKFKRRGFEVFQVALEKDKQDWKNTIREDKLTWSYQVSDLQYMKSETAHKYQLNSLPANFLINPDGVIIARNLYGEELDKKLTEIYQPAATGPKQQ